jgi:hypothetical protein
MARHLPWTGRLALLLFLPTGILPFVYSSAQHSAFNRPLPSDPRSPAAPRTQNLIDRTPSISDWSTRHVIYTQFGTSRALERAQDDPRARFRWQEVEHRFQANRLGAAPRSDLQFRLPGGFRGGRFPQRGAPDLHSDWSISLGNGSTAPAQFPAKYQFNTNAAPDCTNDFAVFPVNTTPSTSQPNIVGFNMLYSGTAGGNGACNSRPGIGTVTIVTGTDNTSSAVVYFNYSVRAITGAVATSPTLSLDGKKIAFVETAAGAAHLHVLAWKAQDGLAMNGGTLGTGPNRQSVTVPKSITTFVTSAPVAGSGTATDLSFGSTSDTNSSPYIDYSNDTAYVGNDAGVLFRFKNVFCTLTACGNAAPSLDTTWGSSGSVTVCSGKLATGATQDFFTGNVYIGCSDGKIYGFTSSGVALANSPVAIGNGGTQGHIADPPIVDSLNQFVYTFSGTGAGGNSGSAVLVQLHTDLSSPRVALVGNGGFEPTHAPAFNDAYFTSSTSTNWFVVAAGYDATNSNLTLYQVLFDANRNMNTGAAAASNSKIGTRLGEYTPLTEFLNGTTDYIFFGLLIPPANWGRETITTFSTTQVPSVPGTSLPNTSTGISGIVVDNNSANAQASSIYFSAIGTNTAVKYTQSGLQ